MPRRFAVGMLCALLALPACGGASQPEEAARPTPDLTRSSGGDGKPRIAIISPKPGDTVRAVKIVTEVDDFELSGKIGKKSKAGQGNIIYYRLDSKDAGVPIVKGRSALTGGRGAFTAHPSGKTSYEWPLMPSRYYPAGRYSFVVQLVNNDNTPLDPAQVALVTLSVQGR